MKFTELFLDVDEHQQKILSMLNDENTIIFFDTNILSYLFKINRNARFEFYSWVSSVKERIKIPEYVVHEYNKRCISNRLNEFNELKSKAKGISKDIAGQREFVCLSLGDESVKRVQGYSDSQHFIDEYAKALKLFNDLSSISDASGEHLYKIASEIKANFADKIISSNFSDLLESCHNEFVCRSHCSVPPGFEDKDAKVENKYGDFIIWKEILRFCVQNEVKKVVLVTRDNKKDFIYPPLKIKVNGILKWNTGNEYVIAHPFLISEFQQQTKKADFEIINFYKLIEFLSTERPGEYRNIARAVQIQIPENEIAQEDSLQGAESESVAENATVNIDDQHKDQTSSVEFQDSCEVEIAREIEISHDSYADGVYIVEPENTVDEIILKLKTHTWSKQNSAILDISGLVEKTLGDYSADKWFVLGRNIYQAASGNAFKAMNFVNALHYKLLAFSEDVANCIVYGMAYEIYFDSNAIFRGFGKFKANFVNEVYNSCCESRYCNARKSINCQFKRCQKELLFKAWPTQTVFFDLDQSLNPEGGITVHNIAIEGKNILTDVSLFEFSYFTVQIEYSFERIREAVCSVYGLPATVVEFRNVDEGLVYTFARNMIFDPAFFDVA